MARFYFVPVEQVGIARGPAYLWWLFDPHRLPELQGVDWNMLDYGAVNYALVLAHTTPEQHDFLNAQAGVVAVPENLDANITSAEINFMQTRLETFNIPANWITSSLTRRTVLRTLCGLFSYMQCLTALTGVDPFSTGVSLNIRLRNIPQGWRDAMQQAADALHYDTTTFTGTTTLRGFLKGMADQWGSQPFYFGDITL